MERIFVTYVSKTGISDIKWNLMNQWEIKTAYEYKNLNFFQKINEK